jgi:hypothetical protein
VSKTQFVCQTKAQNNRANTQTIVIFVPKKKG